MQTSGISCDFGRAGRVRGFVENVVNFYAAGSFNAMKLVSTCHGTPTEHRDHDHSVCYLYVVETE